MLVHHVGVQHAVLLQVMGDGVLGEERGLQADFGANPFAFVVRSAGSMVVGAAAAKLRAEVGTLDFVVLANAAPGFIADRSRDVNFESYDGHRKSKAAADFHGFHGYAKT